MGKALAAIAVAIAVPMAHSAPPYETTTTGTFDSGVECGVANFTRTITVTDSFILSDLDVGFLASHSWRGDMRVDLSHGGTSVRIISSDTGHSPDNYNVQLDDGAATLIRNAPHNTNDGLIAPPYENAVRPNNALSAFNGQNANGTWTLTMCDDYPGADDGTFLRANLYFANPADADLSLGITHLPGAPAQGTNVTFTQTVFNSGPVGATGVISKMYLPTGFTFVSATGGATHSGGVITSSPASIANGGSASFTVTANMSFTGSYAMTGEVTASGQGDGDSTVNNGVIGEDDDATDIVNPSVTPPPSLTCAAPIVHDWDSETWVGGSLVNSYTTSGETLTWTLTGDTGALQANPNGCALPALENYDSGGLSPLQDSLLLLTNYASQSDAITVTVDVGVAGTGVSEAQFALFDVDYGANQFHDRITIEGYLSGVAVAPVLSRSVANSVSGSVALGTIAAGNATADGTVTVTFQSPIDQFVITYGSGTNAPTNPGGQAISIHDVSTCERTQPILAASKITEIWDPSATGLYAVPGNDVVYTIDVTNTGDGPADSGSIELIDAMPSEIEFYNGDIDDGGPESNPVAFSETGTGLTFTYATDVAYSNAGVKPANFAACSYSPAAGYDPNVTFICIKPQGAMAAGGPDPTFQIQFRARIK
jgi:uncharacterized repeat protein (TIGR01451 family)